jgi:DNA invertase Pin-like site-specific DNA recombinase
MKHVKVKLKDGREIEVLAVEVEVLRRAGKLMDEEKVKEYWEQLGSEPGSEKKPAWKLPILTTRERRDRIRRAKKLKRKGYPIREIARQLGVSHVSVLKWFRK